MTGIKYVAAAIIFLVPACGGEPDTEEAVEEVLDQHEDVVEQTELTPTDTSLIAEQVRQRDDALDEAAEATRREAAQKLGDTTGVN